MLTLPVYLQERRDQRLGDARPIQDVYCNASQAAYYHRQQHAVPTFADCDRSHESRTMQGPLYEPRMDAQQYVQIKNDNVSFLTVQTVSACRN